MRRKFYVLGLLSVTSSLVLGALLVYWAALGKIWPLGTVCFVFVVRRCTLAVPKVCYTLLRPSCY